MFNTKIDKKNNSKEENNKDCDKRKNNSTKGTVRISDREIIQRVLVKEGNEGQ